MVNKTYVDAGIVDFMLEQASLSDSGGIMNIVELEEEFLKYLDMGKAACLLPTNDLLSNMEWYPALLCEPLDNFADRQAFLRQELIMCGTIEVVDEGDTLDLMVDETYLYGSVLSFNGCEYVFDGDTDQVCSIGPDGEVIGECTDILSQDVVLDGAIFNTNQVYFPEWIHELMMEFSDYLPCK